MIPDQLTNSISAELQELCKKIHEQIAISEAAKYDLEYKCMNQEREVR